MDHRDPLRSGLEAYGADLSKWPPELMRGARTALLSDPEFRRAWETEQAFDRDLGAERAGRDRAIAQSGALERVRRRVLSRSSDPLSGLRWQRVAAAVLVAGMLGGATDLLFSSSAPEPAEAALLDPLLGLDIPEAR